MLNWWISLIFWCTSDIRDTLGTRKNCPYNRGVSIYPKLLKRVWKVHKFRLELTSKLQVEFFAAIVVAKTARQATLDKLYVCFHPEADNLSTSYAPAQQENKFCEKVNKYSTYLPVSAASFDAVSLNFSNKMWPILVNLVNFCKTFTNLCHNFSQSVLISDDLISQSPLYFVSETDKSALDRRLSENWVL